MTGSIKPAADPGADTWKVRAELAAIKGGVITPFETLAFDTADTKSGGAFLLRRYRPLVGAGFDLKMSPTGPDQASDYVFGKPGNPSLPKRPADDGESGIDPAQILEILAGLTSADPSTQRTLARTIHSILPRYPGNSIRIGEPWMANVWLANGTLPLSGPLNYRVDRSDLHFHYIVIEGAAGTKVNQKTRINGQSLEYDLSLAGSLRGEAEVSRRTGWPERVRYQMELSGRAVRLGLEVPISVMTVLSYGLID